MLSTKDNQAGCAPANSKVGVGLPVAVMVKVPAVPMVNVVESALVMAGASRTGGASCTVMVKSCVASGRVPFEAVMLIGKLPAEPANAVPSIVAVPSPLGVKLIPDGRVPVKPTVALGTGGLVLTVKLVNVQMTNVVLSALIIAGGGLSTNNVKVCIASGAMPFVAVTVNE